MSRTAQGGFTIIELVTVMIIAAVLLVIAAPSFNSMFERRRLEGQANELVADLAYAKSEAVQRNRHVLLRTGGGGNCYTIIAWTEPAARTGSCDCANGPGASCTPSPPGATDPIELKTVTLANSVALTNGVTFDFEPVRGALQSAAAASAVVSLGARNYTVAVAANGRVAPFAP
jgi:prepilin-type N-terminal cleavage/methylation domain-containing protein